MPKPSDEALLDMYIRVKVGRRFLLLSALQISLERPKPLRCGRHSTSRRV